MRDVQGHSQAMKGAKLLAAPASGYRKVTRELVSVSLKGQFLTTRTTQ